MKKNLLRVIHGIFALYFEVCLAYMYYAAFTSTYTIFLLVAVISLAIEGFTVFVLNGGNCPLIHIQRKVGDDTPFFELFFPPHIARRAIPIFAAITWLGVAVLIISLYINAL